jgi:hypothetical protein
MLGRTKKKSASLHAHGRRSLTQAVLSYQTLEESRRGSGGLLVANMERDIGD